MLNELKASLDPSFYEDSISFTLVESKEVIEKNKLSEEELKILNNRILEVKLQLHQAKISCPGAKCVAMHLHRRARCAVAREHAHAH